MVQPPIRRAAAAVALAALVHAAPAGAQGPTGTIQGVVIDASGTALPGAEIAVMSAASGAERRTTSGEKGFFAVPGLPAGLYEVAVVLPGFASHRQSGARVQVGESLTLRLELRTAPHPETITLAETPPVVAQTQSHVSVVMEPAVVLNLPARRRSILDLAGLAPGVTRDARTGDLSVVGLPPAFNRILVDGTDSAGFSPNQETVRELAIAFGAPPAEYGRAGGGTIHVVTNSGTNRVDGSAYEFHGSDGADQFGGTAGGPLVKGEHFAFAAYDGLRASGPSDDADAFFVRTDHQLGDALRPALRYAHRDLGFGSARTFNATAGGGLGASLFNEVRFLYGSRTGAADEAVLDRLQVADTLTWVRGAHMLKGGLDLLVDDAPAGDAGEYSFFLQDEWRPSVALTLNAGVRYDVETFDGPGGDETDTNNVGPRVGAAWAPAGRRYVLRAAYGVLYDRPLWFEANAAARVQQGNAGIEWEWMPYTSLAVNYLFASRDSRYDGIAVHMSRRFAQNHSYRLSYTFGDTAGPAEGPLAFLGARHRFTGSVVYSTNGFADRFDGVAQSLLEAWTLSAIYTAQSGVSDAPAWVSLDARVARDIAVARGTRVALIWEAFNLMDRANVLSEPRVVQLAVRLAF